MWNRYRWSVSCSCTIFLYTVPPPVLSISPSSASVYAGSFMTLDCNIQLMDAVDSQVTVTAVWKKNGVTLTTLSRRRVIDAVLSNSSSYLSQVVFGPFEAGSDDGAYSCQVTVNATKDDDRYILSAVLSSDDVTLLAEGNNYFTRHCMCPCYFYAVPTLTVRMQPEIAAGLTVRPYNTVTLRCVASVPDDVLLQKSFEWREGDDVLTDNGATVVISRHNANMPESVSELTVNNPSIGSHAYFCIVRITIPPLARGLIIDGNASGNVIVRGIWCFAFHAMHDLTDV